MSIILIFSFVLIGTSIPAKLGFYISKDSFEDHILNPLDSNTRSGLYELDQYRRGEKGGDYSRTLSSSDGIGPDIRSYGFVFKPSFEKTPFGSKNYTLKKVYDEWYIFSVSDNY